LPVDFAGEVFFGAEALLDGFFVCWELFVVDWVFLRAMLKIIAQRRGPARG
jgi:hypothetical protein